MDADCLNHTCYVPHPISDMTTIPGGRKVENKLLEKFPDCKITHFVHKVDNVVETENGRWKKVTKKVITFQIQSTDSNGVDAEVRAKRTRPDEGEDYGIQQFPATRAKVPRSCVN